MNIHNGLVRAYKQMGRRVALVIAAGALVLNGGAGIVWAIPSNTGLVAHWSYDQSSGTTLTDNSGNGHNGTLSSTPTWTAGKINNSLAFDGTDSVSAGNITQINGINKLTLATWIKRSSANAHVLVGKQTTNQDIAIEAWDDGRLYFQLSKGSDTYGSIPLNDTAWHHVALVYDGTLTGNANRLKAYVDGVQKTLTFHGTVSTTTTTNTTPFGIGKLDSDYSSGQVDDTWLYARVLSQAEVQDLMSIGTDTTAPTVPANLTAAAASQSQINLSWNASTDNTAVTGYRIYRDGTERTTTTGTTFQDTGLNASTTYSYTVRAYDAAGNQSADSAPAQATTMAPSPLPTVTITATPNSVASGGSSTVDWTSTDAASCSASGGWSGSQTLSGSYVATNITANTTYTLTCSGPGGQANASATVTVLPQCSDGLDNDGDGLVDGADPGCSLSTDNDETDPDVTAPTVSLSAPVDNTTVTGTVTLNADANDNVGVAGVKFYAGTTLIGSEDTSAPYSVSWNTGGVANGPVQLTAVARDAAGNTTTSSVINVTVDNPVPTTRFASGISANGRYLVDQTGAPFLVKGDSPWSIFVDLSPAQAETWAANRESHGFNSAIISLLGNTVNGGPSDSGATYDGVLPFNGGNITSFNEAYWSRVDTMMTSLKNHGITVFLYPLDGWVTSSGGVAYNKSNADCYTFGQMVATRYANYPNIVWMTGGDYFGSDPVGNARFTNMLAGIRSVGNNRPFSIQFLPNTLSTDNSTFEPLAQWNFAYAYSITYQKILQGYNRTPSVRDPRPVILGEANYEGENPSGGLATTTETLRRQQLWALTSGSAGEFTGSQDWQFLSGWQNRLDTSWVTQAQKMRDFFAALNWQQLIPDSATGAAQIVTAGRGTKITGDSGLDVLQNDYVTAAQTPDKSQTVIYVPTSVNNTNARTITLDLTQLPANATAMWVDPTDATSTQAATITAGQVTTPGLHSDGTRDWLLVIHS